jgi:hypothetical protein
MTNTVKDADFEREDLLADPSWKEGQQYEGGSVLPR